MAAISPLLSSTIARKKTFIENVSILLGEAEHGPNETLSPYDVGGLLGLWVSSSSFIFALVASSEDLLSFL